MTRTVRPVFTAHLLETREWWSHEQHATAMVRQRAWRALNERVAAQLEQMENLAEPCRLNDDIPTFIAKVAFFN